MASCSEISLLLGAFEDAELEPHEMQEVARHLATCPSCEAELAGYNTIGRELRGFALTIPLEGFSQSVLARLERLSPPVHVRIAGYFESISQRLVAGLALGASAIALAAVTALIVTPYARQLVAQNSPFHLAAINPVRQMPVQQMAATDSLRPGMPTRNGAVVMTASHQGAGAAEVPEAGAPMAGLFPPSSDSRTVISRLEARSPSVAVWSEPTDDTTVIWVPDRR